MQERVRSGTHPLLQRAHKFVTVRVTLLLKVEVDICYGALLADCMLPCLFRCIRLSAVL